MLDLEEWTINFVKHKDMFSRKLIDFKVEKGTIEFNFKDKKHLYVIVPLLNDNLKKYLKDEPISVVCLNKKENLNFLKAHWNSFIDYSKLNFIFVNPNVNDKWSINPNIHEKVSERESLGLGLKTMFESVPEIR